MDFTQRQDNILRSKMEPKQTDKVLLIGSGPSALLVTKYRWVEKGWVIAVVNHGWMATTEWTYMIHSHDYKTGFPKAREDQYQTDNITSILNKFGGYSKIGFSITLCASYFILGTLKPKVIGYLGCDMNYTPNKQGDTCIYGIGEDIKRREMPDPDRMVLQYGKDNPNYLNDLYMRFLTTAEQNLCKVVNFSNIEDTRLPYPKDRPETFDELGW